MLPKIQCICKLWLNLISQTLAIGHADHRVVTCAQEAHHFHVIPGFFCSIVILSGASAESKNLRIVNTAKHTFGAKSPVAVPDIFLGAETPSSAIDRGAPRSES